MTVFFKFLSNNVDPLELHSSLYFAKQFIIACYSFNHTYSMMVKKMSFGELTCFV